MYQKILATLLHYANADPPMLRREFYAVKERLLQRFGTLDGCEIQEIKKECWGEWCVGCGPDCSRCCGTGIYEIRWVVLERWRWCGFTFHRPAQTLYERPEQVHIHGYVKHRDYGNASAEAVLWLYLLSGEWRLLWRSLTVTRRCGRYWWPLLNVQRVAMELRMLLGRRRCIDCGRFFVTWGSGWHVCRSCRTPGPEEDVPF